MVKQKTKKLGRRRKEEEASHMKMIFFFPSFGFSIIFNLGLSSSLNLGASIHEGFHPIRKEANKSALKLNNA